MKFDRRLTDEIYTSDTVRLGKDAFQAMQETIYHNGGVGTITGYYDAELSILSVSDLLLHNLNHSYASLMEQTKGSLKNLFYKEDAAFLDNARFRQLQGEGEGRILTADGSPVYVRLYKKDAVDTDGTPIWIMSVQMNWAYENLALVNESIHSALWYFECNENGEIVHVNWSHAFRQILGYHDILDFPNKLDSWSNLLHPEDYDRVMQLLLETIADKTNTTKYNVEYRLKIQDGQYHWFRASAEVIRRLDGSANRIAGIISNIDAEKRSRMQAQRAAAFHRAFTSANLCEYYVNLEKNTFDTFKVEPSLMTAFEQNHTWDGLVRFLVDNYVVEEDKKSVTDFYNRAYITEKLKGLETELRQECRIVLDGEERWVSNVVMRGEIEDSEYAMIFLRDITESKAETAQRMQMASDNASMDLLIKSMVRLLDRYGLCPGALLDELPFHTSMYITNNASIGLHHVNHHIYNFGSVTLFFGMGTVEKVAVVEKGEARMKRFLPIGITADERVCSGAHYAAFFGTMSYLLNHPEELEKPPESVRFDEKCEYHVPKVGEQPAKKQKKQQKATVQA